MARKKMDVGPSYDPTEGNEVNRLFEYNEGYGHGRTGAEYKGYGGRGAAIAYGAGYKHGKADAVPVFHDRRMSPNEQVQAANNTRRAGGSQAAQSRAVRRRVVE